MLSWACLAVAIHQASSLKLALLIESLIQIVPYAFALQSGFLTDWTRLVNPTGYPSHKYLNEYSIFLIAD